MLVEILVRIETHASAEGRFMVGANPDYLSLNRGGIDDLLDIVLPRLGIKGVSIRLDLRE